MPARAANELTARWAAGAADGRSLALSGAGVWPLLALLAGAADGETRSELEAAAGVGGDQGAHAAGELLAALAGSESVRLALGAWVRSDLPLTDWWRRAIPAAQRGELTGDAGADQDHLDAWAAHHTDGLIPRMPVAVAADTLLVLASALGVVTRWREPFDDRPMVPAGGPWAGRRLAGLDRESGGADAVALVEGTPAGPLTLVRVEGAGDVDVHLALGDADRPASAVLLAAIRALAGAGRRRPGSELRPGETGPGLDVAEVPGFTDRPSLWLRTPRFDVGGRHDLLRRPELFGLAAASDRERARFPRLSDVPLSVQRARQDVVATFSAVGFRAAAVTAIVMSEASARMGRRRLVVSVVLDRPFAFVAAHRPTGLVLVAGWVADPEAA
jgi:serine protease inhibitor